MLVDELLYELRQVGDTSNLDEGLMMAVRFQIDNVARYVHEKLDEEYHLAVRDIPPNVAPLAPVMWFEYGGASVGKHPTKHYGCLISIDHDRNDGFNAENWTALDIPRATRWILCAGYWINDPISLKTGNWRYYLAVAEDGQLLDVTHRAWNGPQLAQQELEIREQAELQERHALVKELLISLTAICFAHCKGTVIEEHHPTRQVRRAAERKGKPVFTFHTIDIEPSARILRTEGHIAENGLARALHICRGHFAHYTANKPLFGKYTGTFYRTMHLRGKAENGVAIKDYRVHASNSS